MLREDIPIKTCDEIKHSIRGCPTPCNDNERIEGNTIIETYYHWQSVDAEPHGEVETWVDPCGDAIHSCYIAGSRAMFRIRDFLQELHRTGYRLKDIRAHWAEPMVCKMFPANAYIYDDRPVDIAALVDEADFLSGLMLRMQQTLDARYKAINRYYERERRKQTEECATEA